MPSREFSSFLAEAAGFDHPSGLDEVRASFDAAADLRSLPNGIGVHQCDEAPVHCERITPPRALDREAIVYLHGGGYVSGSPRSHRHIAAHLALATGREVVVVDYRLAPEHPFPAARDDVMAVYAWMVDRGLSASLVGDSAGAGLAVSTLLALRDSGATLPTALVGLSPWIDLDLTGPAAETNDALDPMLSRSGLLLFARAYAGPPEHRSIDLEPLTADLTGFPRTLLQVGEHEILLDDAVRLAARLDEAGCDVVLERWPEMVHVWHGLVPDVPESVAALRRVSDWLLAGRLADDDRR